MIWHIWSTGGALGGGFNPASASFATDLTTDANTGNTTAPVVSSATYNFAARDVGAYVFIQAGTNWIPGWYVIASVAANKATLTATIGTSVLYGTSATGLNYQRPNGLSTVAGVATVGTPTVGTWSIDYSQQTAAGITYTDMVIDGVTNTIYTSAANPVGVNVIGNVVNVTSGTGFTVQRVEVLSVSGTQATCDKSLGTLASTGGNGVLGGAISTLATGFGQAFTAGNKIFIKATATYTLTVAVVVTAAAKGDITNGRIVAEGFTTYPGQRDGRPLITSATTTVNIFTLNDNDFWEFIHLKITHTGATRGSAFNTVTSVSSPLFFTDLVVDGCVACHTVGTSFISIYTCVGCEFANCTSATAVFNQATNGSTLSFYGCDIHDNTGDGIRYAGTGGILSFRDCIFDTNAIGINLTATTGGETITASGCVFVDNTADGIKVAANSGTITFELQNNVFYGNVGVALNNLDEQAVADANVRINRNNAYGNNGTNYVGLAGGRGEITLTADPFVNKAGRNFAPNTTAGGGALLRAAGFPGLFASGTTQDYKDVGVQHQDAGGGFIAPTAMIIQNIGTY